MNLIFRFLWMLVRARLAAPRTDVLAATRLDFRCLPHDIDTNRHMTNSRYMSFMDLGRIDFVTRNGWRQKWRAAGIKLMVGSLSIRFRRGIRPFEKFAVITEIASWDERWLYVSQKIMVGQETATIALCKMAFLAPTGRASVPDLLRMVGCDAAPPSRPEALAAKDALDKLLAA